MSLYDHAVTGTLGTGLNVPIRTTRPIASITNDLLVNLELFLSPSVEIFQRHVHPNLGIWASSLAAAKVTTSTEEAAEKVEWIMTRLSTTSSVLLVLLETIVAILVVYLPCFCI